MNIMVYFDEGRMMETLVPSCVSVLKEPRAFFRGLPPTAKYYGSVLILTAIAMVAGFIAYPFRDALMMFMFPVVWVCLVMGLLMWAHVVSWAISAFSDSRLVTSNAFAVLAFAAVPLVLAFIPWVGLAAAMWSIYLMWVGIAERGKVSAGLAAVLVAVPVVLLLLLFVAAVVSFPQLAALLA